MILKECMLIKNDVYIQGIPMTGGVPYGIVVHSTGVNNPNLKRYVQPVQGQEYYQEVLDDLGVNPYGNHWNKSGVGACVNAMIGKNAKGIIETYQTMPWDMCCGGVWKGKLLKADAPCYNNSSKDRILFRTTEENMLSNAQYYNLANSGITSWTYNGQTVYVDTKYMSSFNLNPTACVQFEMLEDNLSDANYFSAIMYEAQEFCAYLCQLYSLPVTRIFSHKESFDLGYGSNHGDPENWLQPFGKNMNWFREEVQRIIDGGGTPTQFYTITTQNQISNCNVTIPTSGIAGQRIYGTITPQTGYRFDSEPTVVINSTTKSLTPYGKSYKFDFELNSTTTVVISGNTIVDLVEIAFGNYPNYESVPSNEWVPLNNYQSKLESNTQPGEHNIFIWIRRQTGTSTYIGDPDNPYTIHQKIYKT